MNDKKKQLWLQRVMQDITREIMNRPYRSDPYALPKLHLPLDARQCDSPEDLLRHIRRENEIIEQIEKDKIAAQLGQDGVFRFGYVPLVIGELSWDYADTVTEMAKDMRLGKTRPLCRAIAELRSQYLKMHNRYIDEAHHSSEIENMYIFEKCVSDIFRTYLLNLKCDLLKHYPDLTQDGIMFLTAVYQCWIVVKSLLQYAAEQSEKVVRIVGHPIGDIVPSQLRKLADLIIEFAGDCPVSPEFDKLQKTYIRTLATQIAVIELTPHKN